MICWDLEKLKFYIFNLLERMGSLSDGKESKSYKHILLIINIPDA